MAQQLRRAELQARQEQKEYDDLMSWLDHAHGILQIVDRQITDRDEEYDVSVVQNYWKM